MSGTQGADSCARTSWIVAAIAGAVVFLLLMIAADWGAIGALIAGIVVCIALGFLLSRVMCSGARNDQPAAAPVSASPPSMPKATPMPDPTPEPEPAPAPVADLEPEPAPEPEPEPVPEPLVEEAVEPEAPVVKPSTPLAGEAELAERKGSWRYEAPEPEPTPEPESAPAAEAAAPEPEPIAADPVSEPDQAETPEPPIAEGIEDDGPRIVPSTPLAGEADLASRKGTWRYEAPAREDAGEKPQMLDGPRDGAADDLKQIKGIGPKLERLCNSLGIYHFDQIAGWSDPEVAWMDANLEGFKGRVSRDEWVAQARVLAEGGATEFSERVGKGGVY